MEGKKESETTVREGIPTERQPEAGMEKKTLGARIAAHRRNKGFSQEKLAEYMGVSRQAVTKWESDLSRPSTENLIRLCDLLEVGTETLIGGKEDAADVSVALERKQAPPQGILMNRIPWLFIGLSVIMIVCYCVLGRILDRFSAGTLILMVILAFPIQLFLHLSFTYAVSSGDFGFLAGDGKKKEYRTEEVKNLLIQIDFQIGFKSSVYILLAGILSICLFGQAFMEKGWQPCGLLILVYVADFAGTILYLNESMIDRIYCRKEDAQRAKRGIPVTAVYVTLLISQMGLTVLVAGWKQIENNTAPALKLAGILIAAAAASTAYYFVESRRIQNTENHSGKYKPGKAGMLCLAVSFVFMVLEWLVF